jgi:hypothetical protein
MATAEKRAGRVVSISFNRTFATRCSAVKKLRTHICAVPFCRQTPPLALMPYRWASARTPTPTGRGKTGPVAALFRPVVTFLGYDPTPPTTLVNV